MPARFSTDAEDGDDLRPNGKRGSRGWRRGVEDVEGVGAADEGEVLDEVVKERQGEVR